jgi:hypothetical protein
MNGAQEVVEKGLRLGLAVIRHTGWWLRWHTDRQASRETAELGLLPPRTADAERRAA